MEAQKFKIDLANLLPLFESQITFKIEGLEDLTRMLVQASFFY